MSEEERMRAEFEKWWYKIGSGVIPYPHHDTEEHTERVSNMAFDYCWKLCGGMRDE